MRKMILVGLALSAAMTVGGNWLKAENWPRFRGPNGTGVSREKGIPTTWNSEDLDWTIAIPGVGHASPIVWDHDLFVTSAVDEGAIRFLYCLDAVTGQTRWFRTLAMNRSHKHVKNSWASSTPTTDGTLVYVAFADEENHWISAYDFDGRLAWRRNFGPFESQHNLGASPILFEDLLIVTKDQFGPSSVMALDKNTGDTRWSVLRPCRKTSYATPMLLHDPDGPQLICVSGASGITSLNPMTGQQNWTTGEFPLRTVASPVFSDGLVVASCGQGGRYGVLQIAADVRQRNPDATNPPIRWVRKKMIPYVPVPIFYGGYFFEWTDQGILACVDVDSGRDIWVHRVGGNFSSSPVCIDGKLYGVSEAGEVVVVAASTEFHMFGRMPLEDPSHATPAVANGRLYLRTFHQITCLSAR